MDIKSAPFHSLFGEHELTVAVCSYTQNGRLAVNLLCKEDNFREPYASLTVNLPKCHQKAIRSNTINKIPRDEWEIVENCHEVIVNKEQWDRVQKLIDRHPAVSGENRWHFSLLLSTLCRPLWSPWAAACACRAASTSWRAAGRAALKLM